MIRQHRRVVGCAGLASLIAVLSFASSVANAQSGGKERFGKAHWENRYSWQHSQHARNYASNLFRYSAAPIPISPQFAKAQSEECGRNLAASEKNLTPVEKAVKGDKELESQVARIRRHLAKANEHFKKMHAECCKKSTGRHEAMTCCHDLITSLDSANKEFAALERLLLQRHITLQRNTKSAAK